MELDRRNFIKFLVGGVAGIHLTPIPWKLTDDIAIWTQNWPWVPVPPVGEFNSVKSVCNLCPGGCGIEVRKTGPRAVKIEGRTDYPVNPGGVCPLGMGGLQLLYDESIRYTRPMKRVGPRGSNTFMDISWNEALSLLAERILTLRRQAKPESVAAIDGNHSGSTVSIMIERLLKAIGSPNYLRLPTAEDTFSIANALMQGTETPLAYDLENSDYILSFGSGLLEGWGAPGRVLNAWNLWHENSGKNKTRIVQIESRASNTASKADQWAAPKPGTEAALALGLAHVIVKEELYNKKFVKDYTFGFDDWNSSDGKHHTGFKTMLLTKYSPARVSEITGLDQKIIIALARDFAGAKAPLATVGKGKGTLNGSVFEFMAIHSLNALMGNINSPGGILVHEPIPLNELPQIEADPVAAEGLKNPRIDQAGGNQYPFTDSLINNLTETILKSKASPVDTLLVFSANPAYTLPDGGAFKKALKKVPFIVSFSPYQDETAYMADLILPDHSYLEKMDDIVWPSGLQYPLYGLSHPVVDPVYNTRNTGDVIIQLSKLIGLKPAFPWSKFEDVLKARVKGLYDAGQGLVSYKDNSTPVWEKQKKGNFQKPDYSSFEDMWKKIKSEGLWYRPAHRYGGWETLFKTPTGKFEFFSTQIELAVYDNTKKAPGKSAIKELGIAAKGDDVFMPHYDKPGSRKQNSSYPLTMLPYEMINLASSWIANPPFLYKTLFDNQLRKEDSFAEINPKTASEYGVKNGDPIIIKSPAGEVRVRAHLFEGAMPGIVFLPLGLGHTAYDEFIRNKGVNPNDIISAGKDPLSGHPVWWDTPVKIIKV